MRMHIRLCISYIVGSYNVRMSKYIIFNHSIKVFTLNVHNSIHQCWGGGDFGATEKCLNIVFHLEMPKCIYSNRTVTSSDNIQK